MSGRWILHSAMRVPRTPEEVFPFFADAANLEDLTPPWLRFSIVTPTPIAMGVGTLIDYRLRVHGLPIGWRTRIAEWAPPHRFADDQLRGPYRRWYHVHTFTPCDGGTELGDRVELHVPGGPLAGLLFRTVVRRDVLAIFRYRAERIAERFGGDPATARVRFERLDAPR